MAKKIALIVLVFILTISTICFGYESNYFTIDIPDNFKQNVETDLYFVYSDENSK